MGKALVLSNVNFSANKIGTVTFSTPVPCTGISLNDSSVEITSIGETATLVATVTPANTTDPVMWESSNSGVVTVANGTLTATGPGAATITASCGEFSAVCAVSVEQVADIAFGLNMYVSKDANKDYLSGGSTLDKYAVVYSESGSLKITNKSLQWYAIPIPANASKLIITAPNAYQTYGFWMSATSSSTAASSVALAYDADSFGTGVSYDGPRTVTIPDRTSGTYQGMNAVVVMLRYNATVTDADVENVSIRFVE